jgi:hypothetical protein
MNSFNTQLHSDENPSYQPTADDWADYERFLDSEREVAIDEANAELQQIAAEELEEEYDADEEWDYEDDGQPDEAQEWYDFDPDC